MPRIRTAHKFSERQRTGDVLTEELVDFKSLLLSPDVLKGLSSSGFERPSPIQLKAIPLGRCGLDLISQAKSGTGKTCVFSVIALESLSLASNSTQVLILAPTREIAVQIKDVITSIGSQMDNVVCHVFIGGLPVEDNKKMLKKPCHIAVGTPGRIKYLIENHFLKTDSVRLFILDEADKLLEDNFQEQINWIFSSLPSNKQMMAFSATYPEYLARHLTKYMREPTFVRLNATDPTLQGIKQFHKGVPFHPLPHKTFEEKVSELLKLLSSLPFRQCLVFSNYQIRAQSLCDTLRSKGWPSVFIAGSQNQSQRLKAMEKLKEFKCRVLISTDLTSRGIDAEHVDLVVNMDVPRDSETYLHRIGRAGRFGTEGVAVTFVAQGEEDKLFRKMEEKIGIKIDKLPDPIPQLLRTGETSSKLASESLQSKTTSVEVDILTNFSINSSEGKAGKNSPELSRTRASKKQAIQIITSCSVEQDNVPSEVTEQDSLEFRENQDVLVANSKDDVDLQPENKERKIAEDLKKTVEMDMHYEKENFDEKLFQKGQGSSDVEQLERSEPDGKLAGIFQNTPPASLQTDLIRSSEEKRAEQQPFLQCGERSICSDEENEYCLSQLQKLKLDSRPEAKCFHKPEIQFALPKAENDRDDKEQCKKVCYQMYSLSSAKELTFETLSEEETSDCKREASETAETCNGLEHDFYNVPQTEEKRDLSHQLPSVKEFEKYFEKYMEKVSDFDLLVDVSSSSSDSEDEVGKTKVNGNDRTEEKVSISSRHANASSDFHDHHQHAQWTFSANQIPYRDNTGDCYDHSQNEYQTHSGYSSHLPFCGEDPNYHWYPNSCYGGWHVNSGSYNYHGNYDDYGGHYNYYYPQPEGYETNYSTQSQAYSPIWGQYEKSWGDIGTYQDYQWNMSWYNAYHRQTSCIGQFIAFSRTVRF